MNHASDRSRGICPGAEIGRQAWLRAMCPLGRAGSSPALGTEIEAATSVAAFFMFKKTGYTFVQPV